MALAVLLGLGLGACDQGAGDHNDTTDTPSTTPGAGDTDGGTGGGDGPACDLVPEVGPALLDFGRCEIMGSGRVIAACGNTGVHRRCDAAFLTWCNDQGGDVSACSEDQAIQAFGFVPCGTGPNAALCDLPFKDNCDSLDGDMTCNTSDCTLGGCALPPLEPIPLYCCSGGSGAKGTGCYSAATCGGSNVHFTLDCGTRGSSCTQTEADCPNGETPCYDCECL